MSVLLQNGTGGGGTMLRAWPSVKARNKARSRNLSFPFRRFCFPSRLGILLQVGAAPWRNKKERAKKVIPASQPRMLEATEERGPPKDEAA